MRSVMVGKCSTLPRLPGASVVEKAAPGATARTQRLCRALLDMDAPLKVSTTGSVFPAPRLCQSHRRRRLLHQSCKHPLHHPHLAQHLQQAHHHPHLQSLLLNHHQHRQVLLAQYSWPPMLSVEVQATALHVWMLHGLEPAVDLTAMALHTHAKGRTNGTGSASQEAHHLLL